MGQGIFITGTDTGVGKTYVTCGLAALLSESGYRVGVMKPAETGCDGGDGKLVPQDALALKAAAGCEFSLEKICPYHSASRWRRASPLSVKDGESTSSG